MSSFELSNSYENQEIHIQDLPFIHVPKKSENFERRSDSESFSENREKNEGQGMNKFTNFLEPAGKFKENQDSLVSFSEGFENKGENWRATDFKNEEKKKEYLDLVTQVQNKAKKFENERSTHIYSKLKENYNENVVIPKNELAEINYSRLLLEKEVNLLNIKVIEKEKEISHLKSMLSEENSGKNMEENRITPLKVIDKNKKISPNSIKSSEKSVKKPEKSELSVKESTSLQKQLHESLKINDKLTESIQNLQEKLKQKEIELQKLNRESKKNIPCVHRSSSSFSNFNPMFNNQELEIIKQDLDNYIKKCNELNQETMKYELEIQEYKQKIEELNFIIEKKGKGLADLEKFKQNSKFETEKLQKEKEKIELELRKTEKNLAEERSLQIFRENEYKIELEKRNSEILNLKRAYEIIHNEKDEIVSKSENVEKIKEKSKKLQQKYEKSKISEDKLNEEINSLKIQIKFQESQSNELKSKLNMLQSHCQSLEFDYSKSLQTVSDTQKTLQELDKNINEKEKKIFGLAEKNKKILQKLEKTKVKLQNYKKEKFSNYNEIKDLARDFMNEKTQVSKLLDQNSELKFHIGSLEEIRDKMLDKIENLTQIKNELLSKNKILEDNFSNVRSQSDYDVKKYIDEYEKVSNELSQLKQDIKKRNEEIILAKAENRKIFQEKNEISVLLQKSQEQEEFSKKLLKTSEDEIQKLSEKISRVNHEINEKEIKNCQLVSELQVAKNQINILNTDLKQMENTLRVLNLDNYSLQTKIEELDKINSQNVSENEIKDDYYKLLRAYQHLSEEFKNMSMSISDEKSEKNKNIFEKSYSEKMITRKNEEGPGKEIIFMNEIEKLQIKLQGALEEKMSIERKLDFAVNEKKNLLEIIEKLKEEIKLKEISNTRNETVMKEVMKYKNEIHRLEADQSKLKKELEKALSKLHSARHKAHALEESAKGKKSLNF